MTDLTPERRRAIRVMAEKDMLPFKAVCDLLDALEEAEADRDLYKQGMNASLTCEQEIIRQLHQARAEAAEHAAAYEARIAELEAEVKKEGG